MLLDLWEWFLLISDGIDLVFSNLANGTYPVPFSFILVIVFFGLISFFAWRSTNIPDLPSPPRPPYVIQITASPATGVNRQSISDVRLLSGGTFFDGSEILNRYHNISRNQATNTDQNSQSATSSPGTVGNVGARNASSDAVPGGSNIRRRIPGRNFLLGLFRRPNPFIRPVPAVSNAIRAQLNSPNLVVYHRVNVYHHHIHSHLGHGQNVNNNNPQTNRSDSNPTQSQNQSDSANANVHPATPSSPSSSSDVPQNQAPSLRCPSNSAPLSAESSSTPSTSRLDCPENSGVGGATVEAATSDTSEHCNSTEVSTAPVDITVSSGAVRIETQAEIGENAFILNPNASVASSSSPGITMPASSGGPTQGGDGGTIPGSHPLFQNKSTVGDGSNSIGSDNSNSPADIEDVHFTIKFLNDTQMDVTSQLGEKIVDFKRRHFATEMSENKTVRLIFNGRVLDNDNKTLREFGIFDQCVVHCLIVSRQQNQSQARGSSGGPTGRSNLGGQDVPGNVRRVVGLPEPGMFFVAFIGIFLIFLWFICLHFGQHLFTQSAVVSLTVLTAIFLIGIVACYLPLPTN